jgi:hypothetical protein
MSYYEKPAVSASALKKFEYSPKLFNDMITGTAKGKDTVALSFGRLVHELVLTPEEFDNKYVVSTIDKPSGQMGELCDNLFLNRLYDEFTDDEFIWDNAYAQVGFKRDKIESVKEKFLVAGKDFIVPKDYYDFLVASIGKQVISREELAKAKDYVVRLQGHKGANKLLFTDKGKVEHEIFWNWESLDAKSKIDKFIIDEENKTIYLIDLKTTSQQVYGKQVIAKASPYQSTFTGFLKDITFYDYLLQMEFYSQALKYIYPDYEIVCYLIPINDYSCTVYELPETWLFYAKQKLNSIRKDIQFYTDTNQWDLSKDDYYHGIINLSQIMI